MPIFRVAFLNCNNLFDLGIHTNRGPQNQQDLNSKIDNLASTLKNTAKGRFPDIVTLCEVGDEKLGRRLAEALKHDFYDCLWSDVPDPKQSGLMIFYNRKVLQHVTIADDKTTRGVGARCKWYAVEFHLLSGSLEHFWLVLNHWKSDYQGEEKLCDPIRCESAKQIGEFFKTKTHGTTAMFLIGDFNCEPGSNPFNKTKNILRGVRERSLVLRDKIQLAYFYNPMWRLHGEADHFEKARQQGYVTPRPPGTFCRITDSIGWKLLDQILVSKRLLTGSSIRFVESSLRITRPVAQCSDHCAISAEFEYN